MPYWEHIMKQVQTKIFAFSRHVPCYNWVRNRGFLVKIQDGNKENSLERRKLRANNGEFCGCVRVHWKQIDVKI